MSTGAKVADAVRTILDSMKLMEFVDNKEDPLILELIVRRHKHNTNSKMLQTS
jgi:hypothetical protein